MSQRARIKIIKNLINNAQTVPTMSTAPKPKTNKVSPVPKTPVNKVDTPKSNVIEPPQEEQEVQNIVPENTIPTTPVVQNNEPQQPQQPEQEEEEEKEANTVYNLVKDAIENKKDKILTAKYYYETMDCLDAEMLKNKTYAAIGADGIMKVSKIDDKDSIVNQKIISMYKPVLGKTNDFIVEIFDKDLKRVVELSEKISKLNIETSIYKFASRYEIKCNSNEELDTKTILSYIEGVTSDMKVNLDSLKVGKLKRVSFSLDRNGEEGTLISIG